MIWLKVTRSNNSPDVILKFYLDSVRELGGCPQKVRIDYGTENGLVAAAQCWFRDDMGSHIYGTSHLWNLTTQSKNRRMVVVLSL
jgi:hypothetical protein